MQFIDHRLWFSYRGLPPHQFMPMLGVHKHIMSFAIAHLDALRFAAVSTYVKRYKFQ